MLCLFARFSFNHYYLTILVVTSYERSLGIMTVVLVPLLLPRKPTDKPCSKSTLKTPKQCSVETNQLIFNANQSTGFYMTSFWSLLLFWIFIAFGPSFYWWLGTWFPCLKSIKQTARSFFKMAFLGNRNSVMLKSMRKSPDNIFGGILF